MSAVRLGTVEVVVFRSPSAPEFLVLQRSPGARLYPGLWQVISGRVEQGEKAWEAAVREVREETGTLPRRLYNTPLTNLFYFPGDDGANLSPVFAALFHASDSVTLSTEHVAYQWLDRANAISRVVWPGQKSAIQTVCDFIICENPARDALEIPLR